MPSNHASLRTWLTWFGAFGLLLPLAFILRWKSGGSGFGTLELVLWPASIMLIGLEGNHSVAVILTTYTLLIAANVVLYALVALLTWPVVRLLLRRMQSPP